MDRESQRAGECPPRQEWSIIASIQLSSARLAAEQKRVSAWKVIRRCPHCGDTSEKVESQPL